MFFRFLKRGLRTGAVLSLATTVAILAASANENDGAWGGINSVCHMIDGDEKVYGEDFHPRDSLLGLALNGTFVSSWGLINELLFGKVDIPASFATSALFAGGAYLVDYFLVPKQYTPGFEKKICPRSIFAIYLVLAIGMALAPLWNKTEE